jgi:RNA polymerase binding protein RbpA
VIAATFHWTFTVRRNIRRRARVGSLGHFPDLEEDDMPDRSLRGMSIGAKSMESDEGVDFAPRFQAHYDCPNGHTIILPFSTEAEVPPVWECRCGAEALLRDAEKPEPKATKPQRTHWDMLLERRTVSELEELLDERLELLRAGKLRRSA